MVGVGVAATAPLDGCCTPLPCGCDASAAPMPTWEAAPTLDAAGGVMISARCSAASRVARKSSRAASFRSRTSSLSSRTRTPCSRLASSCFSSWSALCSSRNACRAAAVAASALELRSTSAAE
eukprot:3925873-Prymnesium_polylepis.1